MPEERWRMRRDLEDMRRRFDEDIVRPVMHAIWERIPEEAKTWSPSIDVFEKGDNIVVKAELPGMRQDDIDVSVTDEYLTIKGEKKRDTEVKDEDYHQSEVLQGPFYRSIHLPYVVDTKNIDALYEDGILRITLQRAAGSKPRKVTIQVKKTAA